MNVRRFVGPGQHCWVPSLPTPSAPAWFAPTSPCSHRGPLLALPRSEPGARLPTAADQLWPGHPLRPHRHGHLVGAHGAHLLLPRGQVSAPFPQGKRPHRAPQREPTTSGEHTPGLHSPQPGVLVTGTGASMRTHSVETPATPSPSVSGRGSPSPPEGPS